MSAQLAGSREASQADLLQFFVATERLLQAAEAVRRISDSILQSPAPQDETADRRRESGVQS